MCSTTNILVASNVHNSTWHNLSGGWLSVAHKLCTLALDSVLLLYFIVMCMFL